jgi:hypothetical protein
VVSLTGGRLSPAASRRRQRLRSGTVAAALAA